MRLWMDASENGSVNFNDKNSTNKMDYYYILCTLN